MSQKTCLRRGSLIRSVLETVVSFLFEAEVNRVQSSKSFDDFGDFFLLFGKTVSSIKRVGNKADDKQHLEMRRRAFA